MTQEMPKRPGGPLQQKPIEIDGVTYDPLHPPKMIRNEDGSTGWIGGKPLETQVIETESRVRANIDSLVETAMEHIIDSTDGLSPQEVIDKLKSMIDVWANESGQQFISARQQTPREQRAKKLRLAQE